MTGFGFNINGFGVFSAVVQGPELWTWGSGTYGELGHSNETSYSSPVQVGAEVNWSNGSVKSSSTVVVTTDGTIFTMGNAKYGRLGHGNTTKYSSPKQVGALTDWASGSMGQSHCMGLKTDGTLWGWGKNHRGQLGDGPTTDRSSPVQGGALTNWAFVESGREMTVARKTDGTIWSWGYGFGGRLGQNNTSNISSPTQIGALTTWATISAGNQHGMAVKTDGTLWAFGQDPDYGWLGLGVTTNYSSPKQVGALTTWAFASCGTQHTIAVKTDGTIWTWGNGASGSLGHGNSTSLSSPVQVGSLTDWSSTNSKTSAGDRCNAMIKTDGTLWTWGINSTGRLGNGGTGAVSSPAQIGALTNWAFVDIGATGLGITTDPS